MVQAIHWNCFDNLVFQKILNLLEKFAKIQQYGFSVLNSSISKQNKKPDILNLKLLEKIPIQCTELVGPKKGPPLQCTELVSQKKAHQFSVLNW